MRIRERRWSRRRVGSECCKVESLKAADSSSAPPGQFDSPANSGMPRALEYLRARFYDPAKGRFTATATVQQNAQGTQGRNLYAYVANNPTTWIDPTGHVAAA